MSYRPCLRKQRSELDWSAATRADDLRPGRGRALVHKLGIEALGENTDWVLLHRDRPVTVPGRK